MPIWFHSKLFLLLIQKSILGHQIGSGTPETEIFGQKRKFSAFGLRFRPPNLKAEYGRKSNFRIINQNTSLLKTIAGNVQENFEKKI